MKTYSVLGNKKKVTMDTNPSSLKIVGNNCVVRVKINYGEIEVIGNDCRIEVGDNWGIINMVGSGGMTMINKRCKGDKVSLVGPNNNLMVDGKQKTKPSYEAQLSPFSKDLDDVMESIFTFVFR